MIVFHGQELNRALTDEEFEELWAEIKEADAKLEAEYEALPEDEKKRLEEEFSDSFYERISEDPLADDDDI